MFLVERIGIVIQSFAAVLPSEIGRLVLSRRCSRRKNKKKTAWQLGVVVVVVVIVQQASSLVVISTRSCVPEYVNNKSAEGCCWGKNLIEGMTQKGNNQEKKAH